MHLKFGSFVLYTQIYRLTEIKNVSMYTPCHAARRTPVMSEANNVYKLR